MNKVRLGSYDNSWYHPGRNDIWRALWLFIGLPLFRCSLLPFSNFRVFVLRVFGARVGSGVVIHSEVIIKYPWHLVIGDDCWIGERSWFDSLTRIQLGNNVCVSQGVYICTGNHDWSDPSFGLRVQPVQLMDGAWAGARCSLLPGTVLSEGAVITAGSVVAGTIPAFEIHGGSPALYLRKRSISSNIEHAGTARDLSDADSSSYLHA